MAFTFVCFGIFVFWRSFYRYEDERGCRNNCGRRAYHKDVNNHIQILVVKISTILYSVLTWQEERGCRNHCGIRVFSAPRTPPCCDSRSSCALKKKWKFQKRAINFEKERWVEVRKRKEEGRFVHNKHRCDWQEGGSGKTCKTGRADESRQSIFLKCNHHHDSILGGNQMCFYWRICKIYKLTEK